jgi:hypothetical protein
VVFVVDKVALGRVFSENFGFLTNSHSTNCSILVNHPIINPIQGDSGGITATYGAHF